MQTLQRDQSHSVHSIPLIALRAGGAAQVQVGSHTIFALEETSLQALPGAERAPEARFLPSRRCVFIQGQSKRLRFVMQRSTQ